MEIKENRETVFYLIQSQRNQIKGEGVSKLAHTFHLRLYQNTPRVRRELGGEIFVLRADSRIHIRRGVKTEITNEITEKTIRFSTLDRSMRYAQSKR